MYRLQKGPYSVSEPWFEIDQSLFSQQFASNKLKCVRNDVTRYCTTCRILEVKKNEYS